MLGKSAFLFVTVLLAVVLLSFISIHTKKNITGVVPRPSTWKKQDKDKGTARISLVVSPLHKDKPELTLNDENSVADVTVLEDEYKQVMKDIDSCMEVTNLKITVSVQQAKKNAETFIKAYRRVVPRHFLSNYSSHCWKRVRSPGNHRTIDHKGNDGVSCLPKLFIGGIAKCGSTFMWRFVNKLISKSVGVPETAQASKEMPFWLKTSVTSSIPSYINIFDRALKDFDTTVQKQAILMDGTPVIIANWPKRSLNGNDMVNYCLLPSTLPHFLPDMKLIAILRNPVSTMYSSFWFSCNSQMKHSSIDDQRKGPNAFHKVTMKKINIFLNCMRDDSDPLISHACSVDDLDYDMCIIQRLHLADKCMNKVFVDLYSPEMPRCGRSRLDRGLYFVHIRRWLSVLPRDKLLVVALEELIKDPGKVAGNVLHFLKISPPTDLDAQSIFSSCMSSEGAQQFVDYKHNPDLQMRPDTKIMLEKFFRPFNVKLAELLNDSTFLWN